MLRGFLFLISFFVSLVSVDALAVQKNAAVARFDDDYVWIRVDSESAKAIREFMRQGPTSRDARPRLRCNEHICAFVVGKDGMAIPIPNIFDITPKLLEDWDRSIPPKKGEVVLLKIESEIPSYQVNISGSAARFLFGFLLKKEDANIAYSVRTEGVACQHEPVSDTYECSFKTTVNGLVSS